MAWRWLQADMLSEENVVPPGREEYGDQANCHRQGRGPAFYFNPARLRALATLALSSWVAVARIVFPASVTKR